mmetsp:Transcript_124670/g.349159  ORF Transcript_124670/g.349159 Transcript_124670/m.349159 type:complete len:253 (+) Transcript_124670:75-833(+)|eukprot:CAMPEP_0176242218 /NCGR_PEP_ID=MMETSP0121_2-20121125/30294_1 /TAXON_ID=160619 /ORGANISM="Kryptoperidinium foliaceum, Strain CCMP 1326" /LENGTH=252 /DNA_ID=CAMNT_0017581771 /DNA_START=75 /DNA_END=833 /DNA_ORIENTATION=-
MVDKRKKGAAKHQGGGKEGEGQRARKKAKGVGEEEVGEGERGFLVVGPNCQDALRGAKDLRLWLEVEADLCPAESAAATVGQAVSTGLDAELAELKAGGAASRRFLSVGMVCRRVCFLRVQDERDVPSALCKRFFGPNAEKRFVSRFGDQVLPVDFSVRPRLEAFETLARETLAPHRGKAWRLHFDEFRGGWNTVSKQNALDLCKDVLSADNQSVSEPEITVICTVCPRFVGLSVSALDGEDLEVPFSNEAA